MPTLDDRLCRVFGEVFALPANQFRPELAPDHVQHWDSLGHLRLVMALQEEFGFEFDVEEVMQMENVARIRERIVSHGVAE